MVGYKTESKVDDDDDDDDRLYSAILRPRADSLRSHVILHEWLAFYSTFWGGLISTGGALTALAWLVPYETAAILAQVLCTPYNHAPCHFMQSHIHEYACLPVTCHLHFRQNDRDLLQAAAVTQGCIVVILSNNRRVEQSCTLIKTWNSYTSQYQRVLLHFLTKISNKNDC